MPRSSFAALAVCLACSACSKDPATGNSTNTVTSANTFNPDESDSDSEETAASAEGTGDGDGDGDSTNDTGILDLPPVDSGCIAVDMLFVIDNSESMAQYQAALRDAFPSFIDSLWAVLPDDVDLHLGITSTDFSGGCSTPEATMNCQSTADTTTIVSHYNQPSDSTGNGIPGSQGRLYFFDNRPFFEANTSDPPDELKTWFEGAAVSAGEAGCSFEMPVAAASWAASPINTGTTGTNNGFFRDEGSLLVIFYLTDEPDKSPETIAVHKQRILDAKAECGGEQCVFSAGLIPACTLDVNQKLWQFMNAWGQADDAPWADVTQVNMYETLVGQVLAETLADACQEIPPVD